MAKERTYPKGRRTCIFCGRQPPDVKITKEHIWNDWLKDILPAPEGAFIEISQMTPDGRYIGLPTIKQGAVHRRTAAIVCNECNGGWMKAVVDDASPIVTKLVTHQPIDLDQGDQQKLATWLTLSSMVADTQTTKLQTVVAEWQRKALYHVGRPPIGVRIWIGTHVGDLVSNFGKGALVFGIGHSLIFSHIVGGLFAVVHIMSTCPPIARLPPDIYTPPLVQIWPLARATVPRPTPLRQHWVVGQFLAGHPAYELHNRMHGALKNLLLQTAIFVPREEPKK